jgi:uncharacterized membrane protein YhaH (DUF805 family)
MESRRYFWGVASYWLLFIIAPTVAAFFLLGASVKSGGFCIGIFIILVLLGEHGIRLWSRLWRGE